MNRIDATFARLRKEQKKAFIAYITAGDPNFDDSLKVIRTLADAGADVIEFGVPFSDPLADGQANQKAAQRALNSGMSIVRLLDLIREFRKTHDTALVIFSYLNPIYTYGFKKFYAEAEAVGADGILMLDLPPDEAKFHDEFSIKTGLHPIRLIAPTTPDSRIPLLTESAGGFIYALSRTGVTGDTKTSTEHISDQVTRITKHTKVPVCVGFGISTVEQIKDVTAVADGVIIGSAIVRQIENNPDRPAEAVREFVTPLIRATHSS